MKNYTPTTDATREQLMDALKERDERIEEQAVHLAWIHKKFAALEKENERLRAWLEDIERNTDPDNDELMPWNYRQVNATAREALEGEGDE